MDKAISKIAAFAREVQEETAILEKFGSVPGVSISVERKVPNTISLHYKPDDDISNGFKWNLFNEGLLRLELLLKQFPNLTCVYATTWIAHMHPKFFEKYGFTVTQPQQDTEGKYSFADEPYKTLHEIYRDNQKRFGMRSEHKKLPPAIAEFSREKFLAPDAEWRKWVERTTKRMQRQDRTPTAE